MRHLLDTIGGLWQLLRLCIIARFRLRGPYLRWRVETAFGSDPNQRPPWRQMIPAILEYARWVHRMRR